MVPRILVVDDEPDLELLIRQRFRKQIREDALRFEFAGNGVQALQKLDEHPDISVILSDTVRERFRIGEARHRGP